MTLPRIVENTQPQEDPCARCGAETPMEHYTVTSPDGPLCEDCAWDTGLGDAAHGLSLIRDALLRTIEQHDRDTVRRYCQQLAQLAADLATGAIVACTIGPDGELRPERPGGDDPHATLRRHFIKPV